MEVKKKAIESHILSISAAFELTLSSSDAEGKRQTMHFDDALHKFFKKYPAPPSRVLLFVCF